MKCLKYIRVQVIKYHYFFWNKLKNNNNCKLRFLLNYNKVFVCIKYYTRS